MGNVHFKKLRKNPNPNDNSDLYINPVSVWDIKSRFGKKKKGWKLDSLDRTEIHKKNYTADTLSL